MKIKIRSFNDDGNLKFKKFVIEKKKEFKSKKTKNFKTPTHLIKDKKLTNEVKNSKEIDLNKKFKNAYEYASYINERLSDVDLKRVDGTEDYLIGYAAYFSCFSGIGLVVMKKTDICLRKRANGEDN